MEGVVVERAPLPEPAPEPIADLLTEALRLGYVLGVRAATTRREEEWDAAEPSTRAVRGLRGAGGHP
jgi:hypothetical protein